ncbi:MAG: tRNA (guanosine(37)-N1)-methyltransferase TrmD [Bdellovibrionaceae bacterium]|nr:tRNA (guanosine(37)-N1)-methyltransferase TrmD [Pseudobdellovibrionaceae bacterium]
MKFHVLTLFPEMLKSALSAGLVGQGLKKNLLQVETHQPREAAEDAHRSVDDRPFGGGDGMIMMADVLARVLEGIRAQGPTRVIYLSPQGPRLDDRKVRELATLPSLTLVCGRYGGIDQRALNQLIDEELSIGDYVLSGGEPAALVVIDSVARMLPGVLGHEESAHRDSFAQGLLEHPNFTRPRQWRGQSVPEALLSGHHGRIQEWKLRLSQLVTLKKRPELLAGLAPAERANLRAFWREMSPEERQACGLQGLQEEDFQRFLGTR